MSTVQEVWPASEGRVNVVEVVVSDSNDLNTVEAVVRSFFRTEAGAMCLQLQSLSYRAFRLQCLRALAHKHTCLLYTSPSPRDKRQSRMPSSA